jgi:hypothetical protein
MIPCSSRSESRHAERGSLGARLVVGALLWACAPAGPPFESVTALPKPARHPAGSDIEPATAWPAAAREGTTREGLVVLETPPDPGAARGVVAAFFRAVVEESPRALGALFAPNAMMQNGTRREGAGSAWSSRFARFDYRSLAGETIYREADIRVWKDQDDWMLEVAVDVAWGARPRMLGDTLTFRLAPSGSGFVIEEILEDFRSP